MNASRSEVHSLTLVFLLLSITLTPAAELERLRYNHPGLTVDLGVGLWAWPLPMDFDQDGDLDLVVSCPDKPYNGTYFFENPEGTVKLPTFKPAVRISKGAQNVHVSHINGQLRVLTPGFEHPDFLNSGLTRPVKLPVPASFHKTEGTKSKQIRANQWSCVDYNGDGNLDLIAGIGDWSHYGWDNAYDGNGQWTNGPLHGYVYLIANNGTTANPNYATPVKLRDTANNIINVYGRPSPCLADFDNDGDLDLLCGEFRDRFTYFQNTGTRTQPAYAPGRILDARMDLCMITPTPIDWDHDGNADLIVGDEDGRVALVSNSGKILDGIPQFEPPIYFQQQAAEIKFGALATPAGHDWDGDGDDDILCGNTAGQIAFIENLGPAAGPATRKWAAPRLLNAGGEPLRILAGPNGSIQGPCETKWGYTTLTVGDWNHDTLPDLLVNSIWGRVVWYRNIGTRQSPRLAAAQPVEVQWEGPPPKPAWNWWNPAGNELATQWRTTPVIVDWNRDGLNDLVMLDHEGYLSLYPRQRDTRLGLVLHAPQRIFLDDMGHPLHLNDRAAGGSGRRKLSVVDWDQDGNLDLLLNSTNADFHRNIGSTREGYPQFKNLGPLSPLPLAGHTSSPTTLDLNGNRIPDLLVGAEDGFLYHLSR